MYLFNTSKGMDRARLVPYFKPFQAVYARVSSIDALTRKRIMMRINLITIMITMTLVQAAASTFGQRVTLREKNASLQQVLLSIKKQTNYTFLYNSELVNGAKRVSLNLENVKLEQALDACFQGQDLSFKIIENTVVIKKKDFTVLDQLKSTFKFVEVKGKVLDEKGLPLPGATVQVKDTKKTVMTNGNGDFVLPAVDEKAMLIVSFIGYKSKEVPVSQGNPLTITLDVNPGQLSEISIVSTGYQDIPKERAAGAITTINADKDLKGKLQTNILDRIEGMSAGLTSYKTGGQTTYQIRGVSSLNAEVKPLIVVDGAPFEGDIQAINPADVESVNILKDATAASIYGARSANGVIVINLRKGKKGPVRINYAGTAKLTPIPNRDYANKMSSSELVDFQRDMFNLRSGSYEGIDPRKSMNDIYRLLYDAKQKEKVNGKWDQSDENLLQSDLNFYRNNDRYDQVLDQFIRKTAIVQQHNLSMSGGSDFYTYNLSGNYMSNSPYEREQNNSRVGFNLNNTFNFTKWLKLNVGVLTSSFKEDYDNGISGFGLLNAGKASYYMLRDNSGNPVNWYNSKSQFEIDRLNALGLQDENYAPVNEMSRKHYNNSSNYLNLNFNANIKIMEGLSLNLLYQKEKTDNYTKQYLSKNAYEVKTMINDATRITAATGAREFLIPNGGQVDEIRGDVNSHTLRAQLNYNKSFGEKHRIDFIGGAEQRSILSTRTRLYRYGYNDNSLSFGFINEGLLAVLQPNTEAVFGSFSYKRPDQKFINKEDRFVSFYGNGSYTFDRKLTATASIRMDQSNLFGTDPKYQYKPLWSTGLLYVVSENDNDWLDRLAVRTTYGINGNISKIGGPYMISVDYSSPNPYTLEAQAYIDTPPNSGLRWEKTKVTNLGLDYSLLKGKFSGSIDFYNKNTTDLLGPLNTDPTIGWSSVIMNYGSMRNRGVDFSFSSNNIANTNFKWNTTLNFNYNKNVITKVENPGNTIYSYVNGVNNRVGKPMNALYSIRYKGLDETGKPIALTKDGREVKMTTGLTVDDLIYEGTTTPPYSASLMNTFSYKDFDLFFMFIYYGGHKMRDVISTYLTKLPELNYTVNMDRASLNYWKKPGDENIPGMGPGYYSNAADAYTQIWSAGNQGIQRADYIKLRDVTLSYSLANEFLKKNYIQKLRLSFQVQNAWRWSANKQNLDPEVWNGTNLTPSRGNFIPATYTFGLSANF
ncbi:SusC/RagA family TonB-linked outer membrane protein [Pedobacter gandavensis]|uniref:SusC/RagA family TonB-linked outer membrane protein n=1 Tax=Pedobacter gandavensis TaxID=2679963 RepID=A0ABR6F176_9SPHI|nr:SusC/RagA family TonB-linked outer membrane protein [Pedobacter gandavensis]MBB2150779.1 SusC/RagA family TonB-linked outer membrane protein [Pedobacter gandavensis]